MRSRAGIRTGPPDRCGALHADEGCRGHRGHGGRRRVRPDAGHSHHVLPASDRRVREEPRFTPDRLVPRPGPVALRWLRVHVLRPPECTEGYTDRAVRINPQWSKVSITLDRAKAVPRVVATFTASAAIPVFNISTSRDDMLTVPTSAEFFLRHEEGSWAIAGWTIHDRPNSAAPLAVR